MSLPRTLAVAVVLLAASMVQAQPWRLGGPRPGARIEELRKVRLIEMLDLKEDQSVRFFARLHDHESAMQDLKKQGKVRAIGCSNMPAEQLTAAEETSRGKQLAAYVTAQDEYSLLVRGVESALVPVLEKEGMGLLPYFQLASGLLTGKYERGKDIPAGTRFARMGRFGERYMSEGNWRIVEDLTGFARAKGHTLLDLAFAWLIAHPVLSSVIAGATRPEQVEQNVRAASWKLTPAEVAEVNRLTAKA